MHYKFRFCLIWLGCSLFHVFVSIGTVWSSSCSNVLVRKVLKFIPIYETAPAGSRRKGNSFTHHWRGRMCHFVWNTWELWAPLVSRMRIIWLDMIIGSLESLFLEWVMSNLIIIYFYFFQKQMRALHHINWPGLHPVLYILLP